MNFKELVDTFILAATSRFTVDSSEPETCSLDGLREQLLHSEILYLRRSGLPEAGRRTVLFAEVENVDKARAALRWAAEVRDATPEPEAADLYMFLNMVEATVGDCLRMEADDQFCRKYVVRPDEECADDVVARSFVAPDAQMSKIESLTDPLVAALASTAETHPWFGPAEQAQWRAILLTSGTGADLAAKIVGDLGEQAT